jgi:hypothetical protein
MEGARFERDQQPALRVGRKVGGLVDQQGTPVGQLEETRAAHDPLASGRFRRAEQLQVERLVGPPAGVDHEQRTRRPGGGRVQRPGHERFAGARLAGDEHVGVRRPGLVDQPEHRLHGAGLGHEPGAIAGANAMGCHADPDSVRPRRPATGL